MKRPAAAIAVHAPCCIVMGVSGCGKSTVGQYLAAALHVTYVEGDDAHPTANIDKMAASVPLTDEDRYAWLAILQSPVRRARSEGVGLVVSCSALKRTYRDLLREANPAAVFVHLHGDQQSIASRLASRSNHFMPPALLQSQFDDLEPLGCDEIGITVDIQLSPQQLVDLILDWDRSLPHASI